MSKKLEWLALGALLLALSFPLEAQQAKKVPRIGILSPVAGPRKLEEAFRRGLRELGYVEGKSISFEYRYAEGKLDRLPGLAAELVRLKVDLIVTSGPAIRAAKQRTSTIPIVMASTIGAVGAGRVASLARPGGNVTGLTLISTDLMGKRLELLKEAFPKISRLAFLTSPVSLDTPGIELLVSATKVAAQSMELKLQVLEVRDPEDINSVLAAMAKERTDALYIMESPVFTVQRTRILEFATKNRLPTSFSGTQFVEAGGLMSYGPDVPDMWRRSATYVDKILKGAKPADLPVEQPTRFELVINLKTAKQIGVTIPPEVLMRADRAIK